jgi:hypothetical protein
VIGAVVSLCDLTGRFVEPWAEAGFECWCVDIQHSIRRDRTVQHGAGRIHFVWGDARSWRPPEGVRFSFAAAFPICTHDAVSGARDFEKKGGYMLRDGLELFEACHQVLAWSGAPYIVEHPVTMLTSIPHIGKPAFWFHPSDYAGYLDDPTAEAYTKKTGAWIGNGFVIPPTRSVDPVKGSAMHLLPPSDDRSNLRSATPRGFSRAAFIANAPHLRAAA